MNKSMFDSIRESLADNKRQSSNFKDFLKPTAGNTYVVRLVPNVESPEKTFFHYYHYGWMSNATGQYVDIMSPKTWGDPDPIEVERVKLYRDKSDERAVALAKFLNTKEKWLVNVYVVDDPVDPENNGTIKILRYGVQLDKIIREAIEGEDAEELGPSIFDFSENGCNLRIKVESIKEGSRSFVNYTSSKFLRPSAIPNMTKEKMKEVFDNIHNIEEFFNRPEPADLKKMLDVHLYAKDEDLEESFNSSSHTKTETDNSRATKKDDDDEDDDIKYTNSTSDDDSEDDDDEDKINELLKDL
jgi:hypothetical protein